MCDTIKTVSKEFKLVFVEGPHHVHLNEPDKVAPSINEFLLSNKNSL